MAASQEARRLKIRRGYKGKNKVINNFSVISVNINGVCSKLASLEYVVNTFSPSVFCLQETKVQKPGKIRFEGAQNYVIYELTRKNKTGGGLAIGVKKDLEPGWAGEGDNETEVLVVQLTVGDMKLRVLCGYGPQETDSADRKALFWSRVHAEVNIAEEEGCRNNDFNGWKSPSW